MDGWDWWIVVGGALQAIGVTVLVVDVVRSFRRMKAYERRPTNVYPAPMDASASVMNPDVSGDQEPTIDERVAHLEGEIRSIRDEMQRAREQLQKEARQAADDAADRASRSAEDRFKAIEMAVLGDTSRDKWRRLVSVGAVVLGIIIATIGSVGGS